MSDGCARSQSKEKVFKVSYFLRGRLIKCIYFSNGCCGSVEQRVRHLTTAVCNSCVWGGRAEQPPCCPHTGGICKKWKVAGLILGEMPEAKGAAAARDTLLGDASLQGVEPEAFCFQLKCLSGEKSSLGLH